MLFITVIKILTLAPALVLLGLFVKNTVKCQLAYLKYRIKLRGLPMDPGRNPFHNHALRICMGDDLCNKMVELYRKDGAKNRWHLIGDYLSVWTVDLDMMKAIVLDEPSKHVNRASKHDWIAREMIVDNLIVARDDQWRRLRRAYAPALRSTKFKTPEVLDEIETSVSKLIDAIEGLIERKQQLEQNQPAQQQQQQDSSNDGASARAFVEFPLHELIHRYSLNLIFSCFYKQPELIDFKADTCHWTEIIDSNLGTLSKNFWLKLAVLMPETQPILDAITWYLLPIGWWRRQLMKFIEDQNKIALEARRKAEAGLESGYRKNMIDFIIDQYLDGKLSKQEYMNSTAFLLSAADLTSVDTIVHTLYELAVNRGIQNKLRESIKSDGTESTYLTWVLNESLRVLAPAPIGCSREISCDIKLESGHVLPAGTHIAMVPNIVHRLKEYWGDDADEFKPERWRDTSHHHPLQYIPFGAGVRQCPGRDFALFEMKKLLVVLLNRYEFSAERDKDVYRFDTAFLIFLNKQTSCSMRIRRLQ